MPAGPPNDPPEDEPGHVIIIITLTPDTTSVTGPTTVTWAATVPSGGEPSLTLSFFEVVSTSTPNVFSFEPITVSPAPTVSWTNGVGTFSVDMDSDIFDQLSTNPTNFTVRAEIPNVESQGMSKIDVDLPSA